MKRPKDEQISYIVFSLAPLKEVDLQSNLPYHQFHNSIVF